MEQEIAKALQYLQEKKFLNDTRFARAYVESILRSKPVGPRYLRAKLRQKGVESGIINQAISQAFQADGDTPEVSGSDSSGVAKRGSEIREAELIQQAASQWKKLHPKHAQDRQRLYRFLLSRGFTNGAINATINTINS